MIKGTGSIAVTGADGQVGRALLAALRDRTRRVIALVREGADLPAHHVLAGWAGSGELSDALSEADAIVHLAGTLRPASGNYEEANVESTRALLAAAAGRRVRRIVFLSYPGANESSRNPYLSTKARAERLLRESGHPVTIFRCTHLIGPPDRPGPTADSLLARGGRPVTLLGTGRQRVRPLWVGDVVSAILAALERDADGVYDLAGPDTFTMDDLVRLLNRDPAVRIRHLPPPVARLLSRVVPGLPPALVDVMLRDSVADPSRSVEAFGLRLTPLRGAWGS